MMVLLLGAIGLMAGCQEASMYPRRIAALHSHPSGPEPFTINDVAAYFAAHNMPTNLATSGQLHVDAVEFLTSEQASDRLRGCLHWLG
jgi:hypothetical protein